LNNYSSLVDILIKDEMENRPQHERLLHICHTPEYLKIHANFPDLPIAITGKVIGKAHFDHGINKNLIKNLPKVLLDAKCVFKSANSSQADSVVILTLEVHRSFPVIVPIRRNHQVGRGQRYNLVTSIYGKEGPDPEPKWKLDGLLLWERIKI
jgi:hypothetical protein